MALRIRFVREDAAPASVTRRRRWTVVGATVVAGFLVTGVSYGYWSATGAGTARLDVVTIQGLTSSSATVTDLYPGKVDDISFSLSNSNSYKVHITGVTAVTVTASDTVNCPASNIALTAGPWPLDIIVNGGNGTAAGSIIGLATMSTSAPMSCQGKNFTFGLTFTGTQQ
jgi:hypothetical protein